jgi:hypothetical protein
MSQYFDVSGVNLISAGGGRLYKNKTALNLSDSTVEVISEGINNEIYSFPASNIEKTTLEIGKDASGKSINGHIKSIFYYPESVTSQQLKALTTRRETTPLPPANEPNFTMAIAIPSANTTWNLRSTGTVSYDVDWGDGQTEIVQTSNTKAHTYVSPGIYKVVVKIRSGVFSPFFSGNADAQRIVCIFGTGTGWSFGTSLNVAWTGARNIIFVDATLNTSTVTIFNTAWDQCSSMVSFPLLNTSNGTSFGVTWRGCSSLTSFPLIDTSKATVLNSTWSGCSSLTSFPLINTSKVTNYSNGWFACRSLVNFPLLNSALVTDFTQAWDGCNALTSFPQLNTSSGTTFAQTWRSCNNLTSFPTINTPNVVNFQNAWNSCSKLTSFPLLITNNATSFSSTWSNCTQLSTFPANMFDSCPATNFSNAWQNCALTAQSIENILVSINTANTSNGTLTLSGGTNATKSTWTTAANDAYDTLISRGWTITFRA